MTDADALEGCLVGLAVGDALGLPREGLTAARARALFGDVLQHAFFAGRGVVSDDTEHALAVVGALSDARDDVDAFTRALAWRIRWWIAAVPPGVGFATLRAGLWLWLGASPTRSGVRSAGNGPAMRAPPIGVFFRRDPVALRRGVDASTAITHRDERARVAAHAVAVAAALAAEGPVAPHDALDTLAGLSDLPEWRAASERAREHLHRGSRTATFADALTGRVGFVSGYALHAVPVALYAWLRHPTDYRAAVSEVIDAGGDTDSTAAITGALVGARVGAAGVPREWVDGVVDAPLTMALLRHRARRLAEPTLPAGPRFRWPWMPVRNAAVFAVEVAHVARRWARWGRGPQSPPPTRTPSSASRRPWRCCRGERGARLQRRSARRHRGRRRRKVGLRPGSVRGDASRYAAPGSRQMPTYQAHCETSAAPDVVWGFLERVVDWPQWTPTVEAVRALGAPALQVGGAFEVVQPKLRPAIWCVTAVRDGVSFQWEATTPGLRMVADHDVSPKPGGGATIDLKFQFRGPLGWLGAFYGSLVREYLDTEARSLAAAAERRAQR